MVTKDDVTTSADDVSQETTLQDEEETSLDQTKMPDNIQALITKAVNDALVMAGRTERQLAERENLVIRIRDEAEKRLKETAEREESLEAQRLEEARDDPARYNLLLTAQQVRKRDTESRQRELNTLKDKQELARELAEGRGLKREKLVNSIVAKYGVDAKTLESVISADMDEVGIDRLASVLPQVRRQTFRPDSGISSGGSTDTVDKVKLLYIQGKISAEERTRRLKALNAL